MEDTEYCSFVTNNEIICECGETFLSEEQLGVHLEKNHMDGKESPEGSEDGTIYYLATNNFVKEELISLEEIKEEVNDEETIPSEENYDTPEQILQIRYPKEEIEEIVEFKTEQKISEMKVKQVVFRKESLLEHQVILAHENEEHCYEKPSSIQIKQFFYCQVCGKTFQTEKNASLHLQKMHLGQAVQKAKKPKKIKTPLEKKAVCDTCGRKYTSNAALRYHVRVHTGEKPYSCPMCPKAFAMPLFLQIHIRTHTGERPYECSVCPKAFGSKAALLRHNRVHTGEKPYACPHCGKCFSQSNSMKLHVHTVHLKMPTPYKSAARKLKALRRQLEVQKTADEFVICNDSEESQGIHVEEISFDDSQKEFIYGEVFHTNHRQ